MPLNLKGAQRAVEGLMRDGCRIQRDEEGTGDDIWDDVTGTYTDPVNDLSLVYEGKCMFSSINIGAITVYGGDEQQSSDWQLGVPKDECPALLPNDVVTIVSVHEDGDQELIEAVFKVDDELSGTYAVTRRARMTRYRPA